MSSSDANLLITYQGGNINSEKKLVFISGFPDNELSGWNGIAEELASTFDCYVLALCLPGLESKPVQKLPRWGISHADILSRILYTIDYYIKSSTFNLVIHDWGSHFGLLLENIIPQRIEKVVVLDVFMCRGSKLSTHQVIIMMIYQLWFAIAYVLSQLFGHYIGQFSFLLFFRNDISCY